MWMRFHRASRNLLRCPQAVLWHRYELSHVVRTHMGAQDASYGCVIQREDAEGQARRQQPTLLFLGLGFRGGHA